MPRESLTHVQLSFLLDVDVSEQEGDGACILHVDGRRPDLPPGFVQVVACPGCDAPAYTATSKARMFIDALHTHDRRVS